MTQPRTPDLDTLLADPARIDEVPPEAIPVLLAQLGAERHRISAIEQMLVARLLAMPCHDGDPDTLLTVEQAAARLKLAPSTIYRKAHTFPFVVRPSPGRVRFSSKGIDAYLAHQQRSNGIPGLNN